VVSNGLDAQPVLPEQHVRSRTTTTLNVYSHRCWETTEDEKVNKEESVPATESTGICLPRQKGVGTRFFLYLMIGKAFHCPRPQSNHEDQQHGVFTTQGHTQGLLLKGNQNLLQRLRLLTIPSPWYIYAFLNLLISPWEGFCFSLALSRCLYSGFLCKTTSLGLTLYIYNFPILGFLSVVSGDFSF
jgi:hypothetical protein